ncbi:uncharacterized protein LOC126708229 [Quercus robur]|uniref:uncharacterized protein LOC126708228 n=1 Tax=Quercus robur TaxID=38942 RepID=UPI002163401C|nr:uncharacterized protein LOC126708228 [Quercus robur]XP_050263989.1 uncharacterized protein LOC126708229 [Quercus robur]
MALRRFLIKSTTTTTPTPTRFPPPPPPPPSAPTTTTTPTRSPPLKPPPAPFTRPLLLLTTHLIPSTPPAPFTPPHLLTSRAFSSPGENSPAKVLVHQFIEKMKNHVSDLPFPPAVKAALHTILKGMLFAAGERAFELLVRVFLWLKEKLLTWWKGKKKAAEDEE